jgi:hypothetical protein
VIGALLALDDKLAAAGIPPLSAWWRGELARFYGSGALLHAARVGRGGAKSTASAKCVLAEVLFGAWKVPPGERHWGLFVSENLDEAKARLGQVRAYLDALGIGYDQTGEQIVLRDRPLGLWVRAARIGAVSGPRVVAWAVDEAAKLSVDGANPTEEIVASLRAATVTHANARGRLYSSPLGPLDYHYATIEAGNTPDQAVSVAASWIANPGAITEAAARKKEPRVRIFDREYRAIPQSAESMAFDAEDWSRCFDTKWPAPDRLARFLFIDASSAREDDWGWLVGGWCRDPMRWACDTRGEPLRSKWDGRLVPRAGYAGRPDWFEVQAVGSFSPQEAQRLTATGVVGQLSCIATKYGARTVFGDQREAYAVAALFRSAGLFFRELTWSSPSKIAAVETLRRWMAEGLLALPDDAALRAQGLSYEEKVTTHGSFRYAASGSGHDDRIATLMTAAMAENEEFLAGSPFGKPPPPRGVITTPLW